MNDNDRFCETFHDDVTESLGLERSPEIAVLVMFILAGLVMAFAMLFNMVA